MQSSIRTPGCIWAKLIEQNNEKARKPESKGDAYVFFVGPRNSGKSTLINRFLYPNRLEVPKPSEGLEYTYARKPSSYDHERKDLAHIWEVGGSQEFAEEISKGDQMFLTAKQLSTAVVVVVVDLSDPSSVLSTAQHWIDQVKQRLGSAYEKFSKRGFDLPDKLKERAKNKLFGKEHKDKDLVYHSGISLVLAATKYDALSEMDPEMKKVVARTLRFLAHANGAHLMYLSNLHASADGRNSVQDKACLDSFTKLMN